MDEQSKRKDKGLINLLVAFHVSHFFLVTQNFQLNNNYFFHSTERISETNCIWKNFEFFTILLKTSEIQKLKFAGMSHEMEV